MLVFVGAKMLIHDWWEIPTNWSLVVVLGILSLAVVASLLRPLPPDAASPDPTHIGDTGDTEDRS